MVLRFPFVLNHGINEGRVCEEVHSRCSNMLKNDFLFKSMDYEGKIAYFGVTLL